MVADLTADMDIFGCLCPVTIVYLLSNDPVSGPWI
jgi:hypothetical protein